MPQDVLDRACRSLWFEIRALCDQQRGFTSEGAEAPEHLRVRQRLQELRALSLRYREVQRREAWARWETG